jgi:hypothetical protein
MPADMEQASMFPCLQACTSSGLRVEVGCLVWRVVARDCYGFQNQMAGLEACS